MKAQEMLETKLKNLTFIVIIGFIVIGLLVIGLYFKNGKTEEIISGNNGGSSSSTTEYDVSAMKTITGKEAVELFDKKGTQFLYIGRPTCGVCVSLVPELNKVISDLKITVNYLELKSTYETDFEGLFDKLDIETSIKSGSNTYEGTYGKLLKEHGFTPLVIIIKDGKMVDGFVGSRNSSTIKELFNKYL